MNKKFSTEYYLEKMPDGRLRISYESDELIKQCEELIKEVDSYFKELEEKCPQ